MAGPQEHRLVQALSGAESGIIDGGADAWQTCASLLRNVAANLATTSLPVPSGDAGAETAAAMNAAFKRSAKAMEERAAKLVAGHGALVDAARVIEDARSAHQALGGEKPAPTYTPHADPGSKAGIKAHNAFLAKQAAFEADQQHRERVCQQQADHMDRTFAKSSAVMKQIHGEKPPATTGGGGGGGGTGSGSSYTPHAATRTSSTYTPGGGGGQPVSGTVHHPAAHGGGSHVDYTAGPGGSTGGGYPTGGGAAQGGVTVDPAGTGTGGGPLPGPVTTGAPGGGLSSTNGLGVAGAAAGGIGGGLLGTGLASGGLRGGMPSLVSSSGTAASGVRGIGATARTGVSGTIGRAGVTGEPTSSTAGRAGAGGVRAGAGSSTSARSGTGRGSASRGSAGGRGSGSTAGGRGGRGKDERKRSKQDAFDLAEDEWLDDEEAAPGVLD